MNLFNSFKTELLLYNVVYKNQVCTSQETHYVSATESNRLMLFGKTVTVYGENHTEYTDTVRTSQETHYVSATEANRLMLFGETVAVYCENHTEHTNKHITSPLQSQTG
jgi:UDP-glucose 6-dehydrogenase